MKQRNVQAILAALASAKSTAATDIELKPAKTRPAFETAIRQAKDEIVALTAEYRTALFADAVGLFIAGPDAKAAEFAAEAQKSAGTLTCDVNEVYRVLSAPIEPMLGTKREFHGLHLNFLVQGIREVATTAEMKVPSLPSPVLKGTCTVNDAAALHALVKELVRNAMGDELMVAYMGKALAVQALAANYAETPAKVVVIGCTAPEAQALVGSFRIRRQVKLTDATAIDASFAIGVVENKKPSQKPVTPPKAPRGTDGQSAE